MVALQEALLVQDFFRISGDATTTRVEGGTTHHCEEDYTTQLHEEGKNHGDHFQTQINTQRIKYKLIPLTFAHI